MRNAKRKSPEIRFLAKVEVRAPDECWRWMASFTRDGYGKFAVEPHAERSVFVGAHRFSYEMHRGQIPDGLHVLHSCDNRWCVNPAHLRTGTATDNMQDALVRKRFALGERHGMAKLTQVQVEEIRRALDGGAVGRHLARQYDVSPATICLINRGRNWRHLEAA